MYKALIRLSSLLLILGGMPAMAADFSEADPAASPPKAAASAPATTFGVEFDTDIQQATGKSPAVGNVSDYYGKFQLSHTFDGGWVASGYFQPQYDLHPGKTDLWRYYAEGDLGYKFKATSNFTLTPSAGIGEVWGDTGVTSANPAALFYAVYIAGDLKLSSNWTWNAFNLRYRNAFDYTWITPKVSTGITYNINAYSAFYGTVGYSWKDTGSGLNPSTMNIGAGLKANF